MTQADEQVLLEVDSRRRVKLGKLARHDRYLVEVRADGTIILRPAMVISVAEFLRLMASLTEQEDNDVDPRDRNRSVPQENPKARTDQGRN